MRAINSNAEANVPTSEPAVEIAYRRPVTVPVSATRANASRLAYGATMPSERYEHASVGTFSYRKFEHAAAFELWSRSTTAW